MKPAANSRCFYLMKSLNLKNAAKRLLLMILVSTGIATAESLQVDYYGVVSSSSDTNMLKMAQDVFYTQLKSIDSLVVVDRRPDISKTLDSVPEINQKSSRIAFYAEIDEKKDLFENTAWNCKFIAVNPKDKTEHSKSEIFESYYKILVNAKNSIESVLSEFNSAKKIPTDADKQNLAANSHSNIDIESLAGTWTGEPGTDKIIILRGGRGFVIYKNGATMNIKVAARNGGNEIEISQVGKSNASFFTELQRETALAAAPNAEPIKWNFKITSKSSLKGTKTTLLQDGDNAKEGTVPATWTKK